MNLHRISPDAAAGPRHPGCRPGCRARHPGCLNLRGGEKPAAGRGTPGAARGIRGYQLRVPLTGTSGAGGRHPGAAAGVPGPAAGAAAGVPGAAAGVPGAAAGAAPRVPAHHSPSPEPHTGCRFLFLGGHVGSGTDTHTHTHSHTHGILGWLLWIGSRRVGRGCGRRLGMGSGSVFARRSIRCVRGLPRGSLSIYLSITVYLDLRGIRRCCRECRDPAPPRASATSTSQQRLQ